MGYLNQGILSSIRGKVGTVIGGRWRGKDYIRGYVKATTTNTEKQQIQRAKFSLGVAFIHSMGDLLETTFKAKAIQKTGKNAALENLLQNHITGAYPNFNIDYPNVKLTAANNLPMVPAPTASSLQSGMVNFGWTDNSATDDQALGTDKAIVVAYCEPLKRAVYRIEAANRNDEAANLNVPLFSGQPVHTWIAFISENGKKMSDTRYTGVVTVQ